MAEQVIAALPEIRLSVRAQRAFLGRAVHYLATEAGIRQFLDIGTGLPSVNNTREVAQRVMPRSRVAYVDNDPIVFGHPGRDRRPADGRRAAGELPGHLADRERRRR